MKNSKKNKTITLILTLIAICLVNIACGEDRREEYHEQTKVDRWIEKTMDQHYYWEITKPDKQRNYFSPPEEFFKGLLSKEDGKSGYHYSYIESLTSPQTRSIQNTSYSYGFEFGYLPNLMVDKETQKGKTGILVFYTVENSPAHEAGLQRGDWIVGINNQDVTDESINTLFEGGPALDLQLATYQEGKDNNSGQWILSKEIHLPGARTIEDHPLHTSKILNVEGKKVGYILYNHFTTGREEIEDDTSYDDAIRQLSREFKGAGVEDVVLDLRYNNGGIISSAALFCEILAPASTKGETMYSLEFNDKYNPSWIEYTFDPHFLGDGVNLDLRNLYVLTSSRTASASELIINSLAPYMKVVIIGDQTEGKNVGSRSFTDDEKLWTLHPIVCKIYNKDKESEYKNGFTPDISSGEIDDTYQLEELGNPNELLLNIALSEITGRTPTEKAKTRTRALKTDIKFSSTSIDRKSTPVLLNN